MACVGYEQPSCYAWDGGVSSSWTHLPNHPGYMYSANWTNSVTIQDDEEGELWWLQSTGDGDNYLYQAGVWQVGPPGPLNGNYPDYGCLINFQDHQHFLYTGRYYKEYQDRAWIYSVPEQNWTEISPMPYILLDHSCALL